MRPPGWPVQVEDPDHPDFEESAVRWLWDLQPAPRTATSVWSRHPRALAFRAAHDIEGRLHGARTAYAQARTSLDGTQVDPSIVLAELEAEAADLQRQRREVDLIEQALAGRRWVSHL